MTLHVPTSYVAGTPVPLVIALHGYSVNGDFMEGYTGFGSLYESEGFPLIAAVRHRRRGRRHLLERHRCVLRSVRHRHRRRGLPEGILDDIEADYDVDPARVFLIGFSNGAFMSYRLACHHADRFAALVSMSGATYDTAGDCTPSEPVSVLQLHGDMDPTILYPGGSINVDGTPVPYPSAQGTFDRWTASNACGSEPADGTPRDLVVSQAGDRGPAAAARPTARSSLWTVAGARTCWRSTPARAARCGPGWRRTRSSEPAVT